MKHSKFHHFDQYTWGRWQLQFFSLPLWSLKGRLVLDDPFRFVLALPWGAIAYTKAARPIAGEYSRYQPRAIAPNMKPWQPPAPGQEWEEIN